jgi:hypothetical protein
MRKYFVSYYYAAKRGQTGYGCTEILRPLPIQSMEDVKDVSKCIGKANNFTQVAILNWRCFEEPADPSGLPAAKEAL